jgi:hypothetical protein
MNNLNTPAGDRPLRTADLAAAASRSAAREELVEDRVGEDREVQDRPMQDRPMQDRDERLAPLFSADVAEDYRARWTAVQGSFVDDPRAAVQQGDELVAQVMKSLAESFAAERDELEGQLGENSEASTETLRVALRRYRSFFERLLAL